MGLVASTRDSLVAKPFIKWAGGKGQLLNTFEKFYPQKLKKGRIETYLEPFLGGGAVLFDVLQKYEIKKAYVFDVNKELIHTYKMIKEESHKLIDSLEALQEMYAGYGAPEKKEMYYSIREKFNNVLLSGQKRPEVDMAAWFIFLNRTCFNGLYRVNRSGFFNVPSGDYRNPKICDRENLKKVSTLLRNVEMRVGDYRESVPFIGKNVFVYFDPPYRPLNPTSRFTSYSRLEFTDKEQIGLGKFYAECHQKGASLMLSNSDPRNEDPRDDFFDTLYGDFHIHRVKAKRAINANSSRRGFINEILVTNYRPNG